MDHGIYITATPIGNLQDITLRALEAIKACDAVICEDSRVSQKLLSFLGVKKRMIVYNDHSDEAVRAFILAEAGSKALVLVSDAGTPLISDPGYKLIKAAQEAGIFVTTLPGACSVVAAVTLSGLPSDNFTFIGFLPQKIEGKRKEFTKYKSLDSTIICFDRGSRLEDSITAALEVFGDKEASVVREISKIYEQVNRNTLSELLKFYKDKEPKGEIVFLISNKIDENSILTEDEINEKLTFLCYNHSIKDAAEIASKILGMKKKEAYERLLKIKG